MNALKVRTLTPELQKTAIDEVNEQPERLPEAIRDLRDWVSQKPDLKACTDDQFLLSFLRGCKYNVEKSQSKLEKFCSMRVSHPELFRSISTEGYLKIADLGIFNYLPRPLNDNGPRIAVFRLGSYPLDQYSLGDILSFVNTMQQILIFEDDYAVIHGAIYIVDFQEASLHHFLQMTPGLCRREIVWNEKAVPLRLKGIHFVNSPSIFVPIFNMVKPMFSEKQRKRLFFHANDSKGLLEHFPKEFLPKEYGGENGSVFEKSKWNCRIAFNHEYFTNDAKCCEDKSTQKEEPVPEAFNNIFGLEGSFKKLNVD